MEKKRKKLKNFLLILSLVIISIFLSIIITITILYNKYDLNTIELMSVNNGIKVYSASGNDSTLYNTDRSIVEIETLPDYVKNAFIDIEDKRFYSHNGYDIKRIIKSMLVNIKNQSKSQGASTISQQLIKNTLLSNEKTYSRKIKELVLSIKMEKQFSKDEILEMYLNTIYFGSNAYGIENASKVYFNKSAKDLTKNEACLLAGIIKSPKTYSPMYNIDMATKRKNLVARKMLESKSITYNDYYEIINTDINLNKQNVTDNSYEEEAIYEACRLLNLTERELINKKYEIITFKQDELQKNVSIASNNVINQTEIDTNSSLDSLSILVNNKGQVLAYHSNSNYNLHNIKRQPASTLKPLAVYLPCFEHNILSPASLILDEAINYNGYEPHNADKQFHGYVTVRNSLSNSYNIPAVKALDYVGLKNAQETLERFGINLTNSDLNLSLALGAVKNGISLLDLTSAYLTLANLGEYYNLTFVNKILDKNGKIIYSYEDFSTKVAKSEDCYLINDILKDSAKSGTSKRLASLNLPIASKTGTAGTSKGNTDLYNISYTSEHTILTWISDIDKGILPESMLSSIEPTEINKQILSSLYSSHSPNDFIIPKNIIKCAYDLVELENNHIIAKPNHNIERYTAYDYFKVDNKPQEIAINEDFDFNVELSKLGAEITFMSKKYNIYNVHQKIKNEENIIATINEKNGKNSILDSNIFKYDEIEYYITNQNNERIGDIIRIRPKDYLINLLNNEMLSSKKRWLV